LDDKQLDAVAGGTVGAPFMMAMMSLMKNIALGQVGGGHTTIPIKLPDSPAIPKRAIM
jgi:hypothetical protein